MNILLLVRGHRLSPQGELHAEPLGPHERYAFHLARGLSATFPGTTVTALTAGTTDEDPALLEAMALGADRAYRLWDPLLGEVDALGVAQALASAVQHLGFDLVLTGARSADECLGFLGPAVAETLSIPHLTEAVELRWTEDQANLVAVRWSASRRYQHTLSMPCLVTIHCPPEGVASQAPRAPAPSGPPSVLSLEDVGHTEALLRPRCRLVGQARPHSPPPYVTGWSEDAATIIEHLGDVDLV